MKLYQQVSLILAHEGVSGLSRRIREKLFIKKERNTTSPNHVVVEDYRRDTKDFYEKALKLGYGDLKKDFWYHTIDLGNELVTPGAFDYRAVLPSFDFPDDMRGMNVLDVGSATGFFAFEFEKRGADVISVDVPSLEDWDRFPGETLQQNLKKLERTLPYLSSYTPEQAEHLFKTSSIEELHYLFLDGPFKFCHKLLNSKVQRRYSTIYDLSKEKLGRDDFDLIFLGDILVHTLYPLKALASVVPLCRGILAVSQPFPDTLDSQPIMYYSAGDKLGEDSATWWLPSTLCFEQILKKFGFKKVTVAKYPGFLRPAGFSYERAIIKATM